MLLCSLSHVIVFLFSVPSLPSDCKTCKILVILTHLGLRFNPQIHLGQNTSETQMTSLLWKTCHNHPNALPGVTVLIISSTQHEQVLIVSFLIDLHSLFVLLVWAVYPESWHSAREHSEQTRRSCKCMPGNLTKQSNNLITKEIVAQHCFIYFFYIL